jgi:hypothetical protein
MLRVAMTSGSATRPNATAVCQGFSDYLNLTATDFRCVLEIPAGSTQPTEHYILITMVSAAGRNAFDLLQQDPVMQSEFLDTISISTSNIYFGLSLYFNPPIGRACLYPGPANAICDSSRGVWIIEGSISPSNTTTYVFVTPTEIRGYFAPGPNSTVTLTYQSTSLNIAGCAKFEGVLFLEGPPLVVSKNSTYVLATFASSCPLATGELPAKFSTITWQTPLQPEQSCQTVKTEPQYGPTTLSLLVSVDSSGCNSEVVGIGSGAVAGIVIAVLAVFAILIVVVVLYRKFWKPKPAIDHEELALATDTTDFNAATTSSATSGKSKKIKKKIETEYAPIDLDKFNADRGEGSAHIVSIPASDVKMLQRLGTGAYGDVWLAQMPDGAFVAVKKMKNTVLASHAAAFFAEASIMMQVTDNPHVVQMLGMIADAGEYGLVMEFMPGGSLETHLQQLKAKLPDSTSATTKQLILPTEARLYNLAYGIASGLSCLADNGIGALGLASCSSDVFLIVCFSQFTAIYRRATFC